MLRENVVPPARNGQEARWTPHSGVLLMEAVVGGGRGRSVLMEAVVGGGRGRRVLMEAAPSRGQGVDDGHMENSWRWMP